MRIGEFIKRYRTDHGMSMQELADKAGLSKAYISMLEKGISRSTGKPFVPAIETLANLSKATNTNLNTMLSLVDGTETVLLNSLLPVEKQKFPVLGRIACGRPIMSAEHLEGYVYGNFHADFCLVAQGDSMIGARIYNGDVVFIRKQPVVENGEIAAVAIDDEITLKRVYYGNDFLELRADNPQVKPMVFRGEELADIRIIGKAVAFQGGIV